MPTIHIESSKDDIAKIVLMPGDPMRAKMIADNYLDDVKLVNNVRSMTAYTGFYKGVKVTIFPSGMGIPSMGIYSYELFKYYDVEKIIRIGTCGANNKDIKLLDIILAESTYSLSTYAKLFENYESNIIEASTKVNDKIELTAKNTGVNIKKGKIITSDVFDVYIEDKQKYFSNYENYNETLASEMEAFSLFFMAKKFKRDAACLLTVVDSVYDDKMISTEDRQNSLNEMITLALNSIL